MSRGNLAWWTDREDGGESGQEHNMKKNRETSDTRAKFLFPCTRVFQPLSALLWQPRADGKVLSACRSGWATGYKSPAAINRSEGFTSWPLGEEPVFTASASFPNLCSMSPAWICYTSFKWIYGPINGESLCIIKSRIDLSGIQLNNYLSNSIIFRYVVLVSADIEDLLGAFDRQDNSTFYCSVTKPVLQKTLHIPCLHVKTAERLCSGLECFSEPGLWEGCTENLYLPFPIFEALSSGQLWEMSASVLW